MKIQSLKLRGAKGIMKGLDLEEVSLDLSGLSGLIALDGPNGTGKSTILENLHGYPTLASRKGALSHHFALKDSFRDLTFTFEGDEIRTLIRIDGQSASKSPEGFIWVNGQPKVDGKISSYKEFITDLLGTPNLFFNSVFCPQNSDTIADMTTGQLKALFSEFLRLHELERHENVSKQAGLVLNGKMESVNRSIENLNRSTENLKQTREDLKTTEIEREKIVKDIGHLKISFKDAEKELATAREVIPKNKALQERVKELTESKGSIEKDKNQLEQDKQQELWGLREKVSKIKDDIKSYEKVLAEKDEIEQAVALERENTAKIAELRPKLDKVNEILAQISTTIHKKEKRQTEVRAKLKEIKGDGKTKELAWEINTLREQTVDLVKRDPECTSTICSFIVKALEAEKRLPDLEKDLEARKIVVEEMRNETEKELALLDTQIQDLKGQRDEEEDLHDYYKTKIETLEEGITAGKDLVAKAGQISVAQTNLDSLKTRKQELIDEGLKIKSSYEERIIANEKRITEILDLIKTAEKSIDNEAEQKVKACELSITNLNNAIDAKEKESRDIIGRIATIESRIKDMEKDREELTKAEQEKSRLQHEISEWNYLKWACGKDALRALEIDAVVPTIMGYSNELISLAEFGCNIKLVTQDEEGREIFDIRIIDEDGEEVLLSNRSGGEKVWPLMALRLAMARVSKEKSRKNYQTVLTDESDGPLSLENAMKYVSLYRAIISGKEKTFENCFFISHKPECVAMADHRLMFGEGIEVE